ncbi:MAG: glycosyl transferase, partial [Prochlorothrix sp.]|nr:glycosyl transferase [Prochlorothrix sp.]
MSLPLSAQTLLQILLLGLICTSLGFYGASALATWSFFSRRRTLPQFTPQPVSILIPVRGIDEGAL